MHPLEKYLSDLAQLRATGAAMPETSGYPALANLFNALGSKLRPKVTTIIQLQNSGAGIPDGGFFTPEQLRRTLEDEPHGGTDVTRFGSRVFADQSVYSKTLRR